MVVFKKFVVLSPKSQDVLCGNIDLVVHCMISRNKNSS